jgi:hypothetical protein
MVNGSPITVESPIIFIIILVTVALIAVLMIFFKQMAQKGRTFSKILFPSLLILLMGICGLVIGIITNSSVALKIIFILSLMLCGGVISLIIYLWNKKR